MLFTTYTDLTAKEVVWLLSTGRTSLWSSCPMSQPSSFKCMDVRVTHGSKFMRLLALYKRPPSVENKLTASIFFVELADVPGRFSSEAGNLLLTGDFSIHWKSADDSKASQFGDTLDFAGLSQHVREQTHKSGHILDLVITRAREKIVKIMVVSDLLSDNHAIHVCGWSSANHIRQAKEGRSANCAPSISKSCVRTPWTLPWRRALWRHLMTSLSDTTQCCASCWSGMHHSWAAYSPSRTKCPGTVRILQRRNRGAGSVSNTGEEFVWPFIATLSWHGACGSVTLLNRPRESTTWIHCPPAQITSSSTSSGRWQEAVETRHRHLTLPW